MDIKESALLGDDPSAHWYYDSKAEAMMRCLEGQPVNRILDVGAGSGYFARHLLAHGRVRCPPSFVFQGAMDSIET